MIIKEASELVLNSNTIFYQEVCDNLNLTRLNLIKAVFQGEIQFTSTEVMQKYNLGTPRNVSKNKEILESKGHEGIKFSHTPDKGSMKDPLIFITLLNLRPLDGFLYFLF
jgi:hypothetical protein